MSQTLDEVLAANAQYASTFRSGNLPVPPVRRIAILTCMDARLDPLAFAGLNIGDAHIIRNAGGRASDDAIRSLLISSTMLGTQEWFVIHHTDCGMETFTDEEMRSRLADHIAAQSNRSGGAATGSSFVEVGFINWLTISDRLGAVVEDVVRIRNHALVPGDIPIYGYLYDVQTGKLIEVPDAMAAGRPAT